MPLLKNKIVKLLLWGSINSAATYMAKDPNILLILSNPLVILSTDFLDCLLFYRFDLTDPKGTPVGI